MTRDRRVTRAVVATVLVLITAGAALGTAVAAAFIWGGIFNVAANEPHWPVTRWALENSLESSVESASKYITVPSVGPERVTQESLRTYSSECAVCHGAPGRDRPDMARNMRPEPPALAAYPLKWSPSERFWIVKNGIKMSGMPAWGPVIADEEIWDLVAVTFALPKMSQQDYMDLMQGETSDEEQEAPDGETQADGYEQQIASAPQPHTSSRGGQQMTIVKPSDAQRPQAQSDQQGGRQTSAEPQDQDQDQDQKKQRAPDGDTETKDQQEIDAPEDGATETQDAEEDGAAAADKETDGAGEQAAATDESEGGSDGGVAATVGMTGDLTFDPRTITISAGETVRWENVSEVPHTVTADEEKANDPSNVVLPDGAEPFDSGFIGPEGTYEKTFTVPGRYKYFCIPHEAQGMIGEVIVE